jgi:cardiolipin synthase
VWPHVAERPALRTRITRTWYRTLHRLLPLGGHSDGNHVSVYSDGDDAFRSMLDAIERAQQRVWLETYILEPDALGLRVLDALKRAAERGADVVLLYDSIGSGKVTREHTAPLLEAGGRVVVFNPFFATGRWRRMFSALTRDHRKILIADEEGFCGGMNMADDYGGEEFGNGRFRDTHARVLGPGVRHLAGVLASTYHLACGEELPRIESPAPRDDGVLMQVLASDVRRKRFHIQRALRMSIRRAVDHCYLTSPYFVPPRRLIRALRTAARRGVDVRVLTAGDSDVPMARRASHHLYGRLLKRGVRIYEMFDRTLHAKTACVDGLYATVGSFNLDHWSHRKNLEVNLTIVDPRTADDVEQQFLKDLKGAREVSYDEWKKRSLAQRAIDWFSYLVMRF